MPVYISELGADPTSAVCSVSPPEPCLGYYHCRSGVSVYTLNAGGDSVIVDISYTISFLPTGNSDWDFQAQRVAEQQPRNGR